MMDERFTYSIWSQTITDRETGERYYGNMQVTELLNKFNETLKPIRKVCGKYNIPLKDLPEILEEYIAYDNDDNW
jgi:hypothetical protein